MNDNQELRRGRHCVFALHAHLIFVTKYRRKVFDADALDRLKAHFARVCGDFEARLVGMNGETGRAPAGRVSAEGGRLFLGAQFEGRVVAHVASGAS